MLPSSTVENYLKAIHQGQSSLGPDQRLVPMGQVASALGVTPGTATTGVLADSVDGFELSVVGNNSSGTSETLGGGSQIN